jgi:hypothetical protein
LLLRSRMGAPAVGLHPPVEELAEGALASFRGSVDPAPEDDLVIALEGNTEGVPRAVVAEGQQVVGEHPLLPCLGCLGRDPFERPYDPPFGVAAVAAVTCPVEIAQTLGQPHAKKPLCRAQSLRRATRTRLDHRGRIAGGALRPKPRCCRRQASARWSRSGVRGAGRWPALLLDVTDGVVGGAADEADVAVIELDRQGGLGDGDREALVCVGAAESDLLAGDHDDAAVRGAPLDPDGFGRGSWPWAGGSGAADPADLLRGEWVRVDP